MSLFLFVALAASIAVNVSLWRGEAAWKRLAREADRQADTYFKMWSALNAQRDLRSDVADQGPTG